MVHLATSSEVQLSALWLALVDPVPPSAALGTLTHMPLRSIRRAGLNLAGDILVKARSHALCLCTTYSRLSLLDLKGSVWSLKRSVPHCGHCPRNPLDQLFVPLIEKPLDDLLLLVDDEEVAGGALLDHVLDELMHQRAEGLLLVLLVEEDRAALDLAEEAVAPLVPSVGSGKVVDAEVVPRIVHVLETVELRHQGAFDPILLTGIHPRSHLAPGSGGVRTGPYAVARGCNL